MDKCQPASIITSSTVHEIIAAGYGMGVSEAERKRFNLREADLASDDIAYIDELSLAGQSLMVMRHGSLYPTCTPGIIAHNGYNNGDHTRNFAQDVRTLGRHLDHTLAQVSVHQLIAHWHDIDQTTAIFGLPRLGRDEKVSAALLTKNMHDCGLPKALAEIAAYGIAGTWPLVNEGGVPVGQWATVQDDYPSEDARLAAHVAATCDLTAIYSPQGPLNASHLYLQRQGLSPGQTPPLTDYERFLQNQIIFLTKHTFPIAEANDIFTGLKPAIIAQTRQKLERVQARSSATNSAILWHELLAMDLAFLLEHNRQGYKP